MMQSANYNTVQMKSSLTKNCSPMKRCTKHIVQSRHIAFLNRCLKKKKEQKRITKEQITPIKLQNEKNVPLIISIYNLLVHFKKEHLINIKTAEFI